MEYAYKKKCCLNIHSHSLIYHINALGIDMHSSSPPAIGKVRRKTGLFNLDSANNLGVGKSLNSNP